MRGRGKRSSINRGLKVTTGFGYGSRAERELEWDTKISLPMSNTEANMKPMSTSEDTLAKDQGRG